MLTKTEVYMRKLILSVFVSLSLVLLHAQDTTLNAYVGTYTFPEGGPVTSVDVKIENDVLSMEARIETTNYNGLEPVYTEYPVGHFARSFTLPEQVDQHNITALLEDGVLTLTLNKRPETKPRRVAIQSP